MGVEVYICVVFVCLAFTSTQANAVTDELETLKMLLERNLEEEAQKTCISPGNPCHIEVACCNHYGCGTNGNCIESWEMEKEREGLYMCIKPTYPCQSHLPCCDNHGCGTDGKCNSDTRRELDAIIGLERRCIKDGDSCHSSIACCNSEGCGSHGKCEPAWEMEEEKEGLYICINPGYPCQSHLPCCNDHECGSDGKCNDS